MRANSFSYHQQHLYGSERQPLVHNNHMPTTIYGNGQYQQPASPQPTSSQAPSLASTYLPPGVQPHRNPFALPPQRRLPQQYEEDDSINCSPCCDNENIRRTIRAIFLGQILSLCLCGTGISSQFLADQGVKAPAAQSFTNYFLLCFVYCISLACKSGEDGLIDVIRKRGWRYFLLAFIDVEANYLIIYAYQFTNLTSIQLLDCATIPTVLFLSWLFLSVRYLISHIIGVTICLIGIACVIWADALGEKGATDGGSNKVLGDLLCLTAAVLYAICNVVEEFLVKQHSRTEYLGMIGLFGCVLSGIQLALFEQESLTKVTWDGPTIGYFLLFGFSMFIFYSFVTVVLQKTSALMFNLSTLTADFYSLLYAVFVLKNSFNWLYFVSFIICVIGSIVYSLRETEVRDADEPRRVCPCLFACCCCCGCFFGDDDSTEGSLSVSPINDRMQMGLNPRQSTCPVHGQSFSRL